MTKYKGILTNTLVDINNVRISKEAIRDILERQPQVPVTINFGGQTIGRTISFYADGELLGCDVELDKEIPLIERSYFVPGLENVEFHMEGRTRVIDFGDLNEVSVSLLPTNPHVSPIKVKGDSNES